MKHRDEIRGFEYDWLASDADGHVALFCTAGGGAVPDSFLRNDEAHFEAAASIRSSEPTTEILFIVDEFTTVEDLSSLVMRGVYIYDADVFGGPYRRVAVPCRPCVVDELPPIAAVVVRGVVFRAMRFANASLVDADAVARLGSEEP